jgi:DNA polymerase-3 subunit delta'
MAWLLAPRATLAALHARGAHALLLHGPAGTGKWELAMAFAGELLCEQRRPAGGACGSCSSCVLLAAGNHPDLRVLVPDAMAERRPGHGADAEDTVVVAPEAGAAARTKPSREIKIEQVRELAGLLGISSHRGGARVVVLGPAEALNLPAANALLKGLEEPPPQCVFVLVTDRIDRCLPTIVSRCALVRVPVPPRAQALAWLQAQAGGRRAGVDACVRLAEAGGGPLAALADQEGGLDADLRKLLTGMLRQGASLAPAQVAAEIPKTVPVGASVALFQRWAWDYFAYRTGAGLRYHPDDAPSFDALAQHWNLAAASAWEAGLRSLRATEDHPLNARAVVEGALLDYIVSIGATTRDMARTAVPHRGATIGTYGE